MFDQPCQPFRCHGARPGQAEHLIGRRQCRPGGSGGAGRARTARSAPRRRAFVRLDPGQHRLRLQRHPRAFHAKDRAPIFTISDRDGGMQVEMLVGIDVIQRQAGARQRRRTGPAISAASCARTLGKKNIAAPARAMSVRKWPVESTRSGTGAAGSTGLPSTSTRCSPTRRVGIACARAPRHRRRPAPATIRLAAVRMPSRCARSTASLTCDGGAEVVRRDDRAVSKR